MSVPPSSTTDADPQTCFHCGLPVPEGANYPITYRRRTVQACCRGCQAVAQTIIDSGQGDYYEHRTALPPTPQDAVAELEKLGLYDLPEIQQSFVRIEPENVREAALILENIVCAACVWLNERHLSQLPGVISVDINYATRRARVRWDSTRLKLSDILRAIQEIGYVAHPFDASKQEEIFRKERNSAIKRLAIAGLGMMQVMMYAIPTYTADPSEMTPDIVALMRWASLILTIPVIFYSAWPFFRGAWKDISRKALGMDVPVAIGIGSAFAASVWATVTQQGEVYYDSVNMFVFLLLTGRFLELNARRRSAQAAEELVKLIPAVATRLPEWPSRREETVPAAQLAPGDHVLIRPGEAIPADGVLVEGESSVVEAMLTGEPEPRRKQPGAQLIGGTLNQQSPMVMRVEKTGEETRLSAIVRLLDRAQSEKPRIGRMADRAASWFVGLLLLFTVIIAAAWYAIDPDKVLWITVSVLVITCPCALGLATPAALTAATGRLTKLGLLTTRGHALETLAQVTDIVFDKTGTLTLGKLSLLNVEPVAGHGKDEILRLAAALEAASEHPIARAIRQAAGISVPSAEAPVNHPGEGVEGSVGGRRYRLGKPAFAGTGIPETAPHPAATSLALAGPDGLMGWLYLGDVVRDDAARAIATLKSLGVRVHLLSGDNQAAANAVAAQLGIEHVRAEALPDDKLSYVKALQAEGRIVAMVGDGINDAPVLAQAQVSIAMGEGTDIAQAAADMVMLGGRLTALADGVAIARKTRRIIHENLAWALSYNLIAIPLAALGHVTPWIAGIGMSSSSLLVVLNALRLTDFESAAQPHPSPFPLP
ncbi:MAG: heavy metal translocating P-type ATPase, partial [Pseudomonadota bacterium]